MSGLDTWSLRVATALGADALALEELDGEEYLSQPFCFTLHMTALQDADASAIVGKPAGVTLQGGQGTQRLLHGIITRVACGGARWVAELRPWLWQLRLASDSRVFQNQSVPSILATLFREFSGAAFRDSLTGSYPALDYCVQYRETAFDFASRLMEEAGIAYHFEYASSAHTLVLTDDAGAFKDCAGAATLPFRPRPSGHDWVDDLHVESAALAHAVVSDGYMTDDFNFLTPSNELRVTGQSGALLVYEYPGRYDSRDGGEAVAKRRLAELDSDAVVLSGTSPVRLLQPGTTVSLTGHPTAALNGRYAIRSVQHHAARREYRNSFTAIPAATRFCPPRRTPLPRIAGAQTAIVVGPSGKEIWTDQYGRIKVQFHWDRRGSNDDTSSCWLRVAQGWSGVSWGAFALPRIGQEVVVTFLEGDPDRPLVTGCVYNGSNPVPYPLPDGQTRTTFKTRSSPGGGGGNELRFEDAKDKEELFFQAQKDLNGTVLNDRKIDIGHDDTLTVKHDRKVTVSEGNAALTVSKGNRSITVQDGDETHTVKGKRSLSIGGAESHSNDDDVTHTIAGKLTIQVDGDIVIEAGGDLTLAAGGNLTLKADGSVNIQADSSATLQADASLTVKAGSSLTATAGSNLTAKASMALALSGGTTMSLKGSASGAVDGGSMLTVKGAMVKIN